MCHSSDFAYIKNKEVYGQPVWLQETGREERNFFECILNTKQYTTGGISYNQNVNSIPYKGYCKFLGWKKRYLIKSAFSFLRLHSIVLKYGSKEKGSSLCKCSILLGFFM